MKLFNRLKLYFSTVTHHIRHHHRWQRTLGTFSFLQFNLPVTRAVCYFLVALPPFSWCNHFFVVFLKCVQCFLPVNIHTHTPFQPVGLCSGRSSASSPDQRHPGVSCPDTFPVGLPLLLVLLLIAMHVKISFFFPLPCFIRILTHSTLGEEGAEFLRSVVLTLPKLTSLKWEFLSLFWQHFHCLLYSAFKCENHIYFFDSVASEMALLDERLAKALFQATSIQYLKWVHPFCLRHNNHLNVFFFSFQSPCKTIFPSFSFFLFFVSSSSQWNSRQWYCFLALIPICLW